MNCVSHLVKESIPNYLHNLPIPDTLLGWFSLSILPGMKPSRVNEMVKMDCAKVVDTFDIEDMGDKAVYCRCWKSKKFPFCDGSHAKHNTETGDNVGPLIIKKSG